MGAGRQLFNNITRLAKIARGGHTIFQKCGLAQQIDCIMLTVPQSVKSNLLAAFRHLLKPLVRLAIKNEVTLREFGEVLKSAYVGSAARQIGMSGGNPTAEAIAVLLNADIGEVQEVLASPSNKNFEFEEPQTTPVSKLLAAWHNDSRYSGPYGVLVDLPFVAAGDAQDRSPLTFSELSRQACPDISPRVLLDECIRTGCVVSVGSGFYRAAKRSHIPDPLSESSIGHFAHVVHNVCETCERNLRTESVGGKGLFERAIFTDTRITKADLQAFDKYVRERGQRFADDIDIWLSSRPIPTTPDTDTVHTGIGIYHYVVNDEDEREFGQSGIMEGKKNAH